MSNPELLDREQPMQSDRQSLARILQQLIVAPVVHFDE